MTRQNEKNLSQWIFVAFMMLVSGVCVYEFGFGSGLLIALGTWFVVLALLTILENFI